jgi:hypothetical protein
MLRSLGGALVLNGLLWRDEVRDVERGIAPGPAGVDENELAAALELVDILSADQMGDIPNLTDHYAQALAELVDAKVHDRELTRPAELPRRVQLVDLMATLQQSVRAARASRGEDLRRPHLNHRRKPAQPRSDLLDPTAPTGAACAYRITDAAAADEAHWTEQYRAGTSASGARDRVAPHAQRPPASLRMRAATDLALPFRRRCSLSIACRTAVASASLR